MNEDILINITPQETRVALILQGAVQELHIERTLTRGLAGNVYSGKVVRVLPGMQSAFIDIGLERAAFLHVADIWEARGHDGQNATPAPIEKILFDGQVLTVQVIKDPIGTKGGAPVDADFHRRAHAGVPAARQAHRHLAENRKGSGTRTIARASAKPAIAQYLVRIDL